MAKEPEQIEREKRAIQKFIELRQYLEGTRPYNRYDLTRRDEQAVRFQLLKLAKDCHWLFDVDGDDVQLKQEFRTDG